MKVGVIGTGSIGKIHLQAYQSVSNAEVVAVTDMVEERARQVSEAFGIPRYYTDYREMLEKEKLDAVSICVPNYLHSPITVDALNAGVNVLCEKPMAINAKEAQKMVDAAKANKKTLMVALCWRFSEEAKTIREFIREGYLGNIYYAKVGILRVSGIPGMGSWFTNKDKSGGGPLIDLAPHFLDLAMWFMGHPKPVSVKGFTFAKFGPLGKRKGGWGIPEPGGKFDVEDLGVALIGLENGATIFVEMSWAGNFEKDTTYCTLVGDKGGAEMMPPRIFTEIGDKYVEIKPEVGRVNTYQEEIKHFLECIEKGLTPLAKGEEGVIDMQIIDAIYESSITGKEVRF
ncbi:MAG: Gfo/Idh/MocA family protein [bacterium]